MTPALLSLLLGVHSACPPRSTICGVGDKGAPAGLQVPGEETVNNPLLKPSPESDLWPEKESLWGKNLLGLEEKGGSLRSEIWSKRVGESHAGGDNRGT